MRDYTEAANRYAKEKGKNEYTRQGNKRKKNAADDDKVIKKSGRTRIGILILEFYINNFEFFFATWQTYSACIPNAMTNQRTSNRRST